MNTLKSRAVRASVALATVAALPAVAFAAQPRTVDQKLAADPQGSVEITNVAGKVEVQGWDRNEIAVTGTLGKAVERLDFTSAGGRAEVRVVLPKSNMYGDEGSAYLVIKVPAKSAVAANVVSADLAAHGIVGRQQLQSVSGNVDADASRETRVRTVSGDVRLATKNEAGTLEIRTVSGDVTASGGAAGEVDVTSVSGDAKLTLGTLSRAKFKTVSGDLTVDAGLANDGRFEAESVSGDVAIGFSGKAPPAEFDVETLSGDIRNCFGPKPVEPKYGPGSRLNYREGAGTAQVRVDTKSGDVRICTR